MSLEEKVENIQDNPSYVIGDGNNDRALSFDDDDESHVEKIIHSKDNNIEVVNIQNVNNNNTSNKMKVVKLDDHTATVHNHNDNGMDNNPVAPSNDINLFIPPQSSPPPPSTATVPVNLYDDDENNSPILITANHRTKITTHHINIEQEYNINKIKQTVLYLNQYHENTIINNVKNKNPNLNTSRFHHYILEYIKSEKVIDELMDTIELLKNQVNQRVKDAWVIGTTVDRQQRQTLDNQDDKIVEASIKYLEASLPPENQAMLEAAFTALRRSRTTDLLKTVNDRRYTQLWIEQEIDTCNNTEIYIEMFQIGTMCLRSLSNVLKHQKHVSAAPLLGNNGPWQCRASKTIVRWIRHIASWLLRFGNWNVHLELVMNLMYMPGISCPITNEKIGFRPLLGIIHVFDGTNNIKDEDGNKKKAVQASTSNLEIPVYDDNASPFPQNNFFNHQNNANAKNSDKLHEWIINDDLLDYFLRLITVTLYFHNGKKATCSRPDIFNNEIVTTAKRMVSSIEIDNEKRTENENNDNKNKFRKRSQFYNQLDIFNVGTGSGTEKTNWYLVDSSLSNIDSYGDDMDDNNDHTEKKDVEPTQQTDEEIDMEDQEEKENISEIDIDMTDDDMVAIYEQLPMHIVCKALFHKSRVETNVELAFARAATLIKIFGQGLFDFGSKFPCFCKLIANSIVNIVTEATLQIDPTDEAGALIESLCLLTIHELQRSPARQVRLYLTRLPYHKCSPDLMWRVLLAVYLGTESDSIRSAFINDGNDGNDSNNNNSKNNTASTDNNKKNENTVKNGKEEDEQNSYFLIALSAGINSYDSWRKTLSSNEGIRNVFHRCLGDTSTFNECARLATLADIAESHGGDIARVVYYELFLASHVAEDARMIWYNQIISHMVTICHSHPQLLSDTLQLTHRCVCNFMKNGDIIDDEEKKFTNVPLKSLVILIKHLSPCFSKWYAVHEDFSILKAWLSPNLPSSKATLLSKRASSSLEKVKKVYLHTREMVKYVIENMNWGSDRKCEQLYLSVEIHRECAVLLSESMSTVTNINMLDYENQSTLSKLQQWWNDEICVFRTWAMDQLLKLCLCNNYIENYYPRILLQLQKQGKKTDANVIFRTKSLWERVQHPLFLRGRYAEILAKDKEDGDDSNNLMKHKPVTKLVEEAVDPNGDNDIDAVTAYTLLLISDAVQQDNGWYLWEALVDQGYVNAALRVLHDISPILYRAPELIKGLPWKSLQTLCKSNNGTLLDKVDFISSVPYGTRAFASMVASQCEYGCMWLNFSSMDLIGEYGYLYLLEELLKAGVEHAIHKHMLVLDETVEWMSKHILGGAKGSKESIQGMLAKTGMLSFVEWGLSYTSILKMFTTEKKNVNTTAAVTGDNTPYPYISFFILIVETFEQRKLYASLCQHFDESNSNNNTKELTNRDEFVQTIVKKMEVRDRSDDNDISNRWRDPNEAHYDAESGISSLKLFQWANMCLCCSNNHSLLPLVWQSFFSLLMTHLKDATASSLLGKWLIENDQTLLKQMTQRLLDLIQYFGNESNEGGIVGQKQRVAEEDNEHQTGMAATTQVRRATVTELAPTLVLHAKKMQALFKGMYHWLKDIGHITCQVIHRLPDIYCPSRLALFVMSANPFCEHHESIDKVFQCLWWDTIDIYQKYNEEKDKPQSANSTYVNNANYSYLYSGFTFYNSNNNAVANEMIDWMPYSRNTIDNSIVMLRQRKDRPFFQEFQPDAPPAYQSFEPTIYRTDRINLRGMEPGIYTNELVELAKRFSKSFSDAMDMDTQVVSCVKNFWSRKPRQMRKRENDAKGRTYEFVFHFMDSVFEKQQLGKARSIATICDSVTMKLAVQEGKEDDLRNESYDRRAISSTSTSGGNSSNSSNGITAASSTIISMMTIEVVVDYLENCLLSKGKSDDENEKDEHFFIVDHISKWFYCMLHCDQDHESWTRKCEYTRDFIWKMIKRLAHLWLSTRPSIEERNNLLIVLTDSIPVSATNERQGIVFVAIMGILQDILQMHFDDHLPFVLRVLVGTDVLPMNVRVWKSIVAVENCWENLRNPEQCCHMLGSSVNALRIRRRDNTVATLSRNEHNLVNDIYNVWDGRIVLEYLTISRRLFHRCEEIQLMQEKQGKIFDVSKVFDSFRALFDPWTSTITLPADEKLNRRAIIQHPWSLNGSMKGKVRSFLRQVFSIVNSCQHENFLFFVWEWLIEICTPLEYVAEDICVVAMEHINWNRMMLGTSEMDKMLEILKEHHYNQFRSNNLKDKVNKVNLHSWVVKMTTNTLSQIDWNTWSKRLVNHTETDEVLNSLLSLIVYLKQQDIPRHIPWQKMSSVKFMNIIPSYKELLFSKESSNIFASIAASASEIHFATYLKAIGQPLLQLTNSNNIDNSNNNNISEEYFEILSNALDIMSQMASPKSKAENDYNGNDLSRIFLSWVDISTLPHGDGNNVYRIKSNNSENQSDDIKETISSTVPMSQRLGLLLWSFAGNCGYLGKYIIANATSIVLSLPNLVRLYERALWAYIQISNNELDKIAIKIPSLSSKEFIQACINHGSVLTLYKIAHALDGDTSAKASRDDELGDEGGLIYNDWTQHSYKYIQDWLKELPIILDARIVPLAYLLIQKSKQLNDKAVGIETTKMLEFLIERMNPSLLSRFTKFVVTRGSNQINHCWSNDFEMSHSCIEKIFNELLNCWKEDTKDKNDTTTTNTDEGEEDGGNYLSLENCMYLLVEKIWTDVLKSPNGETCNYRNEIKWLILFFKKNV